MTSLDESCPDLPDLRHNQTVGKFPRKVNYGFSKKFETTEIRIFNYSTSSLNIDEYTKFLYLLSSYRNQ